MASENIFAYNKSLSSLSNLKNFFYKIKEITENDFSLDKCFFNHLGLILLFDDISFININSPYDLCFIYRENLSFFLPYNSFISFYYYIDYKPYESLYITFYLKDSNVFKEGD